MFIVMQKVAHDYDQAWEDVHVNQAPPHPENQGKMLLATDR